MKRLCVLFLSFIIIFASAVPGASAQNKNGTLESLGNYSDQEYMYENFELNYIYNGEKIVMDKEKITPTEFNVILRVLSDEHLTPTANKSDALLEISDEGFPQKGYVEFLDKDDGNWLIAFDDETVYARCINPGDKSFKHGFFTYSSSTIYNAFRAFLDGKSCGKDVEINDEENTSAKEDKPQSDNVNAEETKRNLVQIDNMQEIYSAHFPLDRFSYDFSWGICSYRRENESEDVTVAYITFEGMEFLKIITEDNIENNTIEFDEGRIVYTENLPGEEYDTDFTLTHSFKLTVDVNDEMQVENARINYVHKSTKVDKTVDVDMNTYIQEGTLPKYGSMAFSAENNSLDKNQIPNDDKVKEENKEEVEEEVKEENKEKSRVYSQTFVGDINKYILREKFFFTFKADKSFEGVLTEEVADIGEEVSVEVRIYLKDMDNKRNGQVKFYNVTILEGSKGKAQLWGGFDYELGYFPLYKPTDMTMHAISANRYLTGSYYEPLVRYSGEGIYNHRFMIKPEFSNNEIKSIKIKYVPEVNGKYDTYATMDGATEGDNLKYELLVPLSEITEKEKEEEEALKERDPENYVTKVRGKMRDGSYHDYRINSIHKISLEDMAGDMPAWYEDLGDNVHMYLLSFTQVWDGKDRNNYTMIKIEGSRDSVWFINGNAEFAAGKNGGKYIVSDYNSLVSFDGFERVRNTKDYDTVTLSVDFETDEAMTVRNITLEIDNNKVSTSEITYIGGGKLTYESFF